MNLLAQPVESITYQDVVDFCDQKIVEGTTLDYKRETPKDLARHVAAMSNRYGGLTVIGVEEDKATGAPSVYTGLSNNGKLVEHANQLVYNVRPWPSCHVCVTDERNGMVFLLIRVNEGGAPPYTTTSDPTVYVRTGNIKTPLGPADTEILRDLFAKRTEGERLQAENVRLATRRLRGLIQQRATRLARRAEQQRRPFDVSPVLGAMFAGDSAKLLTAHIQPFYPRHELARPRDIAAKMPELRLKESDGTPFPDHHIQPVAHGLMSLQWGTAYQPLACNQVYSNGLIHYAQDATLPGPEQAKALRLPVVGRALYLTLLLARRVYTAFGYSGLVCGALELTNVEGLTVHLPPSPQPVFASDRPVTIDNDYRWPLETDTHQLADEVWLQQYFVDAMREIAWDLGYQDMRTDVLVGYASALLQ